MQKFFRGKLFLLLTVDVGHLQLFKAECCKQIEYLIEVAL